MELSLDKIIVIGELPSAEGGSATAERGVDHQAGHEALPVDDGSGRRGDAACEGGGAALAAGGNGGAAADSGVSHDIECVSLGAGFGGVGAGEGN